MYDKRASVWRDVQRSRREAWRRCGISEPVYAVSDATGAEGVQMTRTIGDTHTFHNPSLPCDSIISLFIHPPIFLPDIHRPGLTNHQDLFPHCRRPTGSSAAAAAAVAVHVGGHGRGRGPRRPLGIPHAFPEEHDAQVPYVRQRPGRGAQGVYVHGARLGRVCECEIGARGRRKEVCGAG